MKGANLAVASHVLLEVQEAHADTAAEGCAHTAEAAHQEVPALDAQVPSAAAAAPPRENAEDVFSSALKLAHEVTGVTSAKLDYFMGGVQCCKGSQVDDCPARTYDHS